MTSLETIDRTEIELITRHLKILERIEKQGFSNSSDRSMYAILTKETHAMYDFLDYIKSDPNIFIRED